MTPVTRRTFLKNITVLSAAATVLPYVADRADADAGEYAVGKTTEFSSGDFKKKSLPSGRSVYVAEDPNHPGAYLALSNICTHKGCFVLWVPKSSEFRCPCHGGKFDATGKVTAGPPSRPLESLTTRVEDGTVYIKA